MCASARSSEAAGSFFVLRRAGQCTASVATLAMLYTVHAIMNSEAPTSSVEWSAVCLVSVNATSC